MQRRPERKLTPAQAVATRADAPADDDPVPQDMDEFRNELARRIWRFIGNEAKAWRGCRERGCRRQKSCQAPHMRCSNYRGRRQKSTPEQRARTMAKVSRAVEKQLAAQQDSLPSLRDAPKARTRKNSKCKEKFAETQREAR